MAYQSVHTGPEVDAAVSVLSDVQDIRDQVAADKAAVTTLAGQTATNAGLAQTAATNAQADAASALDSKNSAQSAAQTAGAHAANADSARALAVVARNGAEDARDEAWATEGRINQLLSDSEPTIDELRAAIRRINYGDGPYPSLDLNFVGATMLDPRITFTRASDATYWDSLGALQTAGPNEPRFDYDPVTGESLGLLVEGQATNQILNSDLPVTQSVTVTSAAMTLSFWGTGSVTLSGAHSGSLVGTSDSARAWLTFTPAEAGELILTISGNVERAQLETGTSPTSYIKTEASQVTRAADIPTISVDDFVFRPEEGTLLVEAVAQPLTTNGFIGRIHEGLTLYISAGYITTAGVARQAYMRNGGSNVLALAGGPNIPFGDLFKGLVSWQGGNFVSSGNGTVSAVSNQPDGPPENPTDIRFANTAVGAPGANLWLRRVAYFPRRLPDAKLVELTTP